MIFDFIFSIDFILPIFHKDPYIALSRVMVGGTPMIVDFPPHFTLQCASCLFTQPETIKLIKRDWRGNVKGITFSLSEQCHDTKCPYRKGTDDKTLPTT